jgi:hypothetical protein
MQIMPRNVYKVEAAALHLQRREAIRELLEISEVSSLEG